ncbi:MAG: hypothetical protein K5854_08230 [Prevotella sp.]|jgi:hypothetical protein|nr:hypothetical protein [Prevotella sp.]
MSKYSFHKNADNYSTITEAATGSIIYEAPNSSLLNSFERKHPFISGIGSILGIGGNYYDNNDIHKDNKALWHSDMIRIGHDIYNVLSRL